MPDWPHAPVHRLGKAGAYIVTAGTYRKEHFFKELERLAFLHDSLLAIAMEYEWRLQAWAVFSNHYHFVGNSPDDPSSLGVMIGKLHTLTAAKLNALDECEGRKVWYQYWDSHITYEKSYLARLNYVHNNPVRHGLVQVARQYPWCSAAWFENTADRAFFNIVTGFPMDRVKIFDEF
ncbi:MAG TPA: transposase [Armatimonadota bacterium]|nr:transposase [Armatimonadota bacterium]